MRAISWLQLILALNSYVLRKRLRFIICVILEVCENSRARATMSSVEIKKVTERWLRAISCLQLILALNSYVLRKRRRFLICVILEVCEKSRASAIWAVWKSKKKLSADCVTERQLRAISCLHKKKTKVFILCILGSKTVDF